MRETIENLKENNRPINLIEISKETGLGYRILSELNIKNLLIAARIEMEKQKIKEIAIQLKEEVLNYLSEYQRENEKVTGTMVYKTLSKKKSWIYHHCPDVKEFISKMVFEINNNSEKKINGLSNHF